MGRVHTITWNVGGGTFGDLDQVGPEALDLGFQIITRSPFVAVQQVLGPMRDSGEGNILIAGAAASRRGEPFTTAFAAGKTPARRCKRWSALSQGPRLGPWRHSRSTAPR